MRNPFRRKKTDDEIFNELVKAVLCRANLAHKNDLNLSYSLSYSLANMQLEHGFGEEPFLTMTIQAYVRT